MNTITVEVGGRTEPLELVIEEYQPIDPAAYCYDPGWICFEKNDVDAEFEYFVSQSGSVYIQPQNIVVGCEPNIVKSWEDHDDALFEGLEDG